MATSRAIANKLIEEGTRARAHFQVWWTLRSLALPTYYESMNDVEYVDFFHASNEGHYVVFILSLVKIFDRDPRVAGVKELRRVLRSEGYGAVANRLSSELKSHEAVIRAAMAIRNRSLVHNEHGITRTKLYKLNGVTPNQLRGLIDAACTSINGVAGDLGVTNRIFDGSRVERATLKMLQTLQHGRTPKPLR